MVKLKNSLKIVNSKFRNSTRVTTTEKKIKKKFKSELREEWRFEILALIGSHVKEKEKKNH